MLIRSYITTQLIQITHFNEMSRYTNMAIAGPLLLSKTI